MRPCAPPILLKAICRSYAAKSEAEIPGISGAAGGGRGVEIVPAGVGLLPHEHCQNINTKASQAVTRIVASLGFQISIADASALLR